MFALALSFVFPAAPPPAAEVRQAAGYIGNRFRVTLRPLPQRHG